MLFNTIVCFDFETGSSRKSDTEIIQIAALAINPRNLTVIPGGEFETMVMALEPDKLQDEALAVNKKTREEIAAAPHPQEAWNNFARWVAQWNYKGKTDSYNAPIPAGHNIIGFDLPIYERYCRTYGTIRKGRNGEEAGTIFNNFWKYDTMQMAASWWEGMTEPGRFSLDAIRQYMDMPKGERATHDALQDVRDTAAVLIKFLQLQRAFAPKVIWKDAFNPEKVEAELGRRAEARAKQVERDQKKKSR